MRLVKTFIENEGDQDVMYEDFLYLINRNGEYDDLKNRFKLMSMQKNDMMYGGHPSERLMRDSINKVKLGIS